ncbi:response regulator, partial [candidate division GN15 bacterium]|nr:response regulator [candidate division GN15 bacterium]
MKKLRLLYIEDKAAQRQTNARRLRARGFGVTTAPSGRKGLAKFDSDRPDVVLCDLNLPDLSGLQVLERVKAASPATPVIILTAHGSVSLAREAIKQGAYHFILKPLEINDLEITIHQALEDSRLHQQLREYSHDLERKVS